MLRRFVWSFAVLIAALGTAQAGGNKGDWELGVFAGFSAMDEYMASDQDAFAALLIADDDLNPDDDVFFGLRVGYFLTPNWSLEGAFQTLSTEVEFDQCAGTPCPGTAEATALQDLDLASLRFNLLYHWRQGLDLRPYFTFGVGLEATDIATILDEQDVSYNVGVGIRWFLTDRFSLRLEDRYVVTEVSGPVNDSQTNLEASFGLSWTFGGGSPIDTDGDRVVDRKDKCPLTPKGALVDLTGCPLDEDGDGVPDGIDQCPGTPAGTEVTGSGCLRDTDGDGVADGDDQCPQTPRGAAVGASGCPKDSDGDGVLDGLDECTATPLGAIVDASGCPKDDDGDGVLNGLDRCPTTPAGTEVDASGCRRDSDGDGVNDAADACPGTSSGVQVDRRGCEVKPVVTEEPVVLQGVRFESDSAELVAHSYPVLDRMAAALREWKGGHVEIAGHTDSSGDTEHNMELSRRRAETVRDYLRSRGVDDGILVARGYGESRPIADNSTPEGRAQNRRVELRELE